MTSGLINNEMLGMFLKSLGASCYPYLAVVWTTPRPLVSIQGDSTLREQIPLSITDVK